MGITKRVLEECDQAMGVTIQAGAIALCPNHSDVQIYQGDPEADNRAYAIGTNLWKNEEFLCAREDFMDAIKDCLDMAADGECPACARIFSDD